MMIGHPPRSVAVQPRRVVVWGLAAVAMLTAPSAGAAPEATAAITTPYHERSVVLAIDARCRMFTPDVATALKAATLQARGAAARAGADDAVLAATEANARDIAGRTSCDDPELAVVRGRVSAAYSAWAGVRRMEFPGERSMWKADRTRFSAPAWRLVQTTKTGAASVGFGIVAGDGALDEVATSVSFPGKSRPIAARIVMRDAGRLARPWRMNGAADLPPEAGRSVIYAAASREAGPALLAEGRKQGEVWIFGSEAATQLAALDPSEPFVVEFLFRDDSIARARFEVGDLAAGQAFTAMGPL